MMIHDVFEGVKSVVVKYPFIKPLRLRGGAGGKAAYVPVGELSEEKKVARKAYENQKKRAQRARARGITVEEYVTNKGKQKAQFVLDKVQPARKEAAERTNVRVQKRLSAAEKKKVDQENKTRERKAVREYLARQKKVDDLKWNKSKWGVGGSKKSDHGVSDLGQSIRRSRNRLVTKLRRDLDKSGITKADFDDASRKVQSSLLPPLEIRNTKNNRGIQNIWVIDGVGHRHPEMFLDLCRPLVRRVIEGSKGPSKKVRLTLNVNVKNVDYRDGHVTEEEHGYKSGTLTFISKDDFPENWEDMTTETILPRLSTHQLRGSGWALDSIIDLTVVIDNFSPLSGRRWIPLPDWVAAKKAIINPENRTGSDCFLLSVAIHQIMEKHPDIRNIGRLPKIVLTKAKELTMGDIELPMKVDDITKFEELNPGMNILVLGLNEEGTEVVRLRSKRRSKLGKNTTIVLFLWGDGNDNYHYGCVRSYTALMKAQIPKSNGCKKKVCLNCCNMFGTEELKKKHEESSGCFNHNYQPTEFEDESIRFKNRRSTQRVPFVIYSDLEAYNITSQKTKKKNTTKISEQVPSGIGYVIVGPKGFKTKYRKFDTAREYADTLDKDVREIREEWYREGKPLVMNTKDTKLYNDTKKCYQCGWVLVQGENKHRDHDHFTGRFRGAACIRCNLAMKKPKFIPVYFHNLEGYDSHLIIREISKLGDNMTCIPHTKENYISFSVALKVPHYEDPNVVREEGEKIPKHDSFSIRFLDSFKLMSSGLGSLVETLHAGDLNITREVFGGLSEKKTKLLRRKGVYPYDWVSDAEKLRMTKLPPIEAFFNTLSEEECTPEDYEHAQEVWKEFRMKTMQDYHDLYLKSDITQLADVVEKFRGMCHNTYKLDPSWYYTAPSLSWDAMLKMTDVVLKTIPEPDMHLFVERCTRGGISVIVKRYSEANHKYMVEYDPEKPSVFIIDLDRNNLYGEAMSDMLPRDGLAWMTEVELENWNKSSDSIGCFLEVDLEYPDHLHDLHNDYPMACERIAVEGGGEDNVKLVPNLNNKKNYVIHHEELKLCLKHGLVLTKVHKGLKFNQSPWLREYISMNTELRTKATTKFGKDFYKLMNNSVFGKTMENVRNRVDVHLITDNKGTMDKLLSKRISKPEYKSTTFFSDNLAAVELMRGKIKLNKPIYVGAAILSISKVKMYEFFYEYVKPKWSDNVKLLFTDTDSLCLEIHTEDFHKDTMDDVEEYFDTSEVSPDHRFVKELGFPVGRNKKALRKMKDEAGGRIIVAFVGLRSKMYAIKMEGSYSDIKKCKGIKTYVANNIEFEEYKRCLFERAPVYKSQNTLRNHGHRMYVERMTKKALCGEDNKRVISEDRVNTLAHGHWRLRE